MIHDETRIREEKVSGAIAAPFVQFVEKKWTGLQVMSRLDAYLGELLPVMSLRCTDNGYVNITTYNNQVLDK